MKLIPGVLAFQFGIQTLPICDVWLLGRLFMPLVVQLFFTNMTWIVPLLKAHFDKKKMRKYTYSPSLDTMHIVNIFYHTIVVSIIFQIKILQRALT